MQVILKVLLADTKNLQWFLNYHNFNSFYPYFIDKEHDIRKITLYA